MTLPCNYDILGFTHPDILANDLHVYQCELLQKYTENLKHLSAANSQAEYKAHRLQVGLCRHCSMVCPTNHCLCQASLLWTSCIYLF